MKAAGVAGEEILNAVVANSATFETKTQFSQVWPRCSCLSQHRVVPCMYLC